MMSPPLALGPAENDERGRSSGVEHNLAKVGVESSNLFARSITSHSVLWGCRRVGPCRRGRLSTQALHDVRRLPVLDPAARYRGARLVLPTLGGCSGAPMASISIWGWCARPGWPPC